VNTVLIDIIDGLEDQIKNLTSDLAACEAEKNSTQTALDACLANPTCTTEVAPDYSVTQPTTCDSSTTGSGYWLGQLIAKFNEPGNSPLPNGVSLCSWEDEVIFDLGNGGLRRTGVGIGGKDDPCDNTKLLCAKDTTYGGAGTIYLKLLEAMTRADYLHPETHGDSTEQNLNCKSARLHGMIGGRKKQSRERICRLCNR